MATIAVVGTLDSKGEEHAFLAEPIRARGHRNLLVDVGSGGPPSVTPDITREQVIAASGLALATILGRKDLGGGGGTAIATAARRAVSLGFPKLMVSTPAAGNTAHYLGTKRAAMRICPTPSMSG
jgi:uncharacterized protein (UPF0261 family)